MRRLELEHQGKEDVAGVALGESTYYIEQTTSKCRLAVKVPLPGSWQFFPAKLSLLSLASDIYTHCFSLLA